VDITDFWSLLEAARAEAADASDDQGKALSAALVDTLAATSALTIFEYEQWFERLHDRLYRWDVWAAASLIHGGCSDDSFMDFRAGLIAQGRDWYERVCAEPDALAEHPDVVAAAAGHRTGALFQELVTYIASSAYDRFSAESEDGVEGCDDGPEVAFYEAYEAFTGTVATEPDDMGEDFDFDDPQQMRTRLPRLAGMFLA
jgi:hypothetical protein